MRFGWLMNKGDDHRYIIMDSTNEDIDDVDPLLYLKATYFARACFILQYKIPVDKVRELVAHYQTEDFFANYPNSYCPIKLRKILRTIGKKEQEKLLQGFQFSYEEFMAFLLFAGRQGFLFSQYAHQREPDKSLKDRMPVIIDANGGEVKTVGKTDLSEGALRTIVNQNKRIIAQFLTKGDRWVCFYRTRRGLNGEEPGKHGHEPHMHFISCDYGMSKEDIINGIKNGETPSNGYHVRIKKQEYGVAFRGSIFD